MKRIVVSIIAFFVLTDIYAQSYMSGLKTINVSVVGSDEIFNTNTLISINDIQTLVELKLRMIGLKIDPDHYEKILVSITGIQTSISIYAVFVSIKVVRPVVLVVDIVPELFSINGEAFDYIKNVTPIINKAFLSTVWEDGTEIAAGNIVFADSLKTCIENLMNKLSNEYLKQNQ